jgi:hypothetical protein
MYGHDGWDGPHVRVYTLPASPCRAGAVRVSCPAALHLTKLKASLSSRIRRVRTFTTGVSLPPCSAQRPSPSVLQVIQKRRGEKTEVRAAARDAALR